MFQIDQPVERRNVQRLIKTSKTQSKKTVRQEIDERDLSKLVSVDTFKYKFKNIN